MITIRCGVNSLTRSDLVGHTVADIRDEFADSLSIPDNAGAKVNNCNAGLDVVVCDNAVVEFVKVTGEKGN